MSGRSVLLALGRDTCKGHAVAMATRAIVDNANMVHRGSGKRDELIRRMAGLARPAGRQVVARFSYRRHADKHLAVMAVCAITEDAAVTHHARSWTGS